MVLWATLLGILLEIMQTAKMAQAELFIMATAKLSVILPEILLEIQQK